MSSNLLLKLAAVASSLFLVGGLVSYRAGAFDSLVRPARPAVEPVSNPVAGDGALIYSTKSAPIFLEESSPPEAVSEDSPPQRSPAVMGGSKFSVVFDPLPPPAPDAAPPSVKTLPETPPTGNAKSTKRTTVMSSSKSIVLESDSNRSVIEILQSLNNAPLDSQPPATSTEPRP